MERRGPRAGIGVWDARVLTILVAGLASVLSLSGRLLGAGLAPGVMPVPILVTFPAAYLAGVLAFLSPCSGAIIPAFFAYSFTNRGRLIEMTYVFYLGLATVFVPIGFATSLFSDLFIMNRTLFFQAGGAILILLGLVTIVGFAPWAALSSRSAGHLTARAMLAGNDETPRVYVMGLVFGLATSSCTAPIIGAIQLLALGSAFGTAEAILLFLVFALGIVTPLFALAVVGDRTKLIRGGLFHARPLALPVVGATTTTRLLTGVVLIALGGAFIVFDGTLALTEQYAAWGLTDIYGELNDRLLAATVAVPQVVWASLFVLGLVATYRLLRAASTKEQRERGGGRDEREPRDERPRG